MEVPLGELINLNKARKARDRAASREAADVNRASHGRSRAEREAAEAERLRLSRILDGSKLED